jgi:hypothetical protein
LTILHADELDRIEMAEGFVWRPIRRRFDINAFGVNAYSPREEGPGRRRFGVRARLVAPPGLLDDRALKVSESLGQVLWAFGFAGLGISGSCRARAARRCPSGEQAADCWGRCWGDRPLGRETAQPSREPVRAARGSHPGGRRFESGWLHENRRKSAVFFGRQRAHDYVQEVGPQVHSAVLGINA